MPLPASTLAFVHRDAPGADGVAILDLSSGTGKELAATTETIWGVAISPDRKWIAYSTDDAIYVVGADGSSPRRLSDNIATPSNTHAQLGTPEWSPDGTTIYVGLGIFSNTVVSGGIALARMPAAGGKIVPLDAAVDNNCQLITAPKFAPGGGSFIAVHSTCVTSTTEGMWTHAPSGAGQLLAPVADAALTPGLVMTDGSVFIVGNLNWGAYGLVLIRNGAVAGGLPPPANTDVRALTGTPDGSLLVIERETSTGSDLFATTDGMNYMQLTNDGASRRPQL